MPNPVILPTVHLSPDPRQSSSPTSMSSYIRVLPHTSMLPFPLLRISRQTRREGPTLIHVTLNTGGHNGKETPGEKVQVMSITGKCNTDVGNNQTDPSRSVLEAKQRGHPANLGNPARHRVNAAVPSEQRSSNQRLPTTYNPYGQKRRVQQSETPDRSGSNLKSRNSHVPSGSMRPPQSLNQGQRQRELTA
ncbi:hypothetical protein PFJ87_11g02360 [Encephalitozoon hellem]|uniref:Uncharacterized protein n=1 Tax=Encephalitozoon hellem TaxID=27973 RepID=A0ABY8CLB7_ENCHE|nr:hypothetical protein PFJ87_01g00030 [Encephalitozoon hellem]WEL37966.1 hypothetical protein PFJ87_01g02220 [Encephalitozoon hellem]WEL37967.1 hypothetical protein PFJ87_02g00030 [Encephalitozoon hellem]WEL38334.1 hypothetical protein PFJ87_04g00030 [Encephalitozoon hellem]WEL38536.1 hypothetical protein PFJ87_05g00040 [Encephalitozoon hellem]